MIYTSNFSIIKKLSDNLTIPVSISRNSPDWYDGLEYKKLSPSSDLLYEWKKNKDIIKYIKRYKSEVLDKLSINEVISDLLTLTNNKKRIKICS